MARIRTIKPEFPQSESIGKLSRDARLLYIQIWTIVDDAGRARAASRMLASLLYPYDDDARSLIDGWLDELEQGKHIRRYEVDGSQYLEVVKWLEHQKIDKPSKSRLPEFVEGSRIVAKPREASATDLVPRTVDLVPVPRTKETREDALSLASQFDEFWSLWPNKVGKPAALKAFRSALKRATFAEIMAGVENYIRDKPLDRSWLNPATFLNQNRWEDQPAAVGATNGKIGNISSACDNLVELVNRGFGGAPPQDSFGGGADEADVKLLSYGRG